MFRRINKQHRYLIKSNVTGRYAGSTNDAGKFLPDAHCLVDTTGEDGLGTINGSKGIADFLRAKQEGRQP